MSQGTLDAEEFMKKRTAKKPTAKTSKPKPATEGEKIVCRCYSLTLDDLRCSSAESGFRSQAKAIDMVINRRVCAAVKDALIGELVSTDLHELHNERIKSKYGVSL